MGFVPFRNLIAAAVAVSAAACCMAETFPLKGARVVYADEYAKTKDEPWGRESAIELAQILSKLTASEVKAYPEAKAPEGAGPTVYVGPAAATKGLEVGKEGRFAFRVKVEADRVFLFGRNETGSSYAVTEFLEECCGYRYLAQNGENPYAVDPDLAVACTDFSRTPAIPYRSVYRGGINGVRTWVTAEDLVKTVGNWGNFFRQRRLNIRRADLERSHVVRLENHSDAHNAFAALPPEKYFKDHPDWYSMDENGVRVSVPNGGGQLCYSNLAMRDEYVKNLLEKIRTDREGTDPSAWAGLYDCSQLDNTTRLCCCPACKKVIAKYNRVPNGHREGGDAGLQLEFANDVAARVAAVYPDVRLRFFAYVSTEEAPKDIGIHPNVRIWWCDVYSVCDHQRPLTHPLNRKNHDELVAWLGKTKNFQLWDYMLYGTVPEVNADALAADARLFRDLGVDDVFMETEYGDQPFYDLHLYLISQLYFDPDASVARLIREWCAVYGAAAKKMEALIATLVRLERENPPDSYRTWHQRELPWYTVENFERLRAMAEEAYALADSRAARCRVANVLYGVNKFLMDKYASLYGRDAEHSRTRADYVRYAKEWGASEVDDPVRIAAIGKKMDDLMKIETLRFTDLPPALKDVPPTELKCLDLRSGKFGGGVPVVADPLSEAGKVVRLEFPKPVTFPIPAGVYDVTTAKMLTRGWTIPRPADLKEDAYFWTKLGEVTIGQNSFLYLTGSWRLQAHFKKFYVNADGAPVDLNRYEIWASLRLTGPVYFEGSKEADAVWYDRIALRRILPEGEL